MRWAKHSNLFRYSYILALSFQLIFYATTKVIKTLRGQYFNLRMNSRNCFRYILNQNLNLFQLESQRSFFQTEIRLTHNPRIGEYVIAKIFDVLYRIENKTLYSKHIAVKYFNGRYIRLHRLAGCHFLPILIFFLNETT